MMKRKLLLVVTACVLVVLLGVMAFAVEQNDAAAFSCYTYDSQGNRLDGYRAENSSTWYLFVTSTVSLEDVVLHYCGDITAASSGVLDSENCVVTGAFSQSGDQVALTASDSSTHSVVVMQSDLPSVYIDLEGTTLSKIHADKDEKHKGNSISIMDPAGEYDLLVEDSVEIKGRGNSTWRMYEKKAYQIKFDSKTSVMGMGKAKKWVLLANASDDSMMRTQLVSRMADNLDLAFVTSFEYVDLWIEGEYVGTYLLGEKVEPGSSRLDLQNDSGALFEHDEDFYLDEDYWFYSPVLDRHFTMKEIVEEEDALIQEAMAGFQTALEQFVRYLYSTPADEVTLEDLSAMIDVDSFAKYYLVNEYALNRESFSTSFYWYQDGAEDVIHLGPLWDFDTCMGNDGEPNTKSYGHEHVLFHYLLAIPAFRERTLELLEEYRAVLETMTADVDAVYEKIADSAEMNYLRWNVLGKPNPKGGADFYPTYGEAVDALRLWLQGREEAFQVSESNSIASIVSEDCWRLQITFPDADYESVRFGVWSQDNDRDDLAWYSAQKDEDGTWCYSVDLGNHNSSGIYYIYAFVNGEKEASAMGRNYVEAARMAKYYLQATLSDDESELTVKLTDTTEEMTSVRFDIWGASSQETTLKRLPAAQDDQGCWSVTIPVCAFNLKEADNLVIHAYGVGEGVEMRLNERLSWIKEVPAHSYPDEEDAPCEVCGHVPGSEEEIAKTPMYRLYNPNSGEHFYTGSEVERDFLQENGWMYEGVAWHSPVFSGIPVHRVYNPNSGDHHYTMSEEEVAMLVNLGWQYEGICWNSALEGSAQYRLYNPNADLGSHHYTSSDEERDYLVELGWILEGIGWFGVIGKE